MKPTEILKHEHRVIEKMISVLDAFCKNVEKGDFKREDAQKIVDFFKTFADKCHHGKEENMLFPEMEKAGVPKEGGPIGVMLFEHKQGRNFIKGMDSGIKENNAKSFLENARNYINLLKEHIYKEDNILFNIAEAHLTSKVQENLIERFEKFENEVIGKEVHEKYHELVHQMEKKYM